MKCKDCPHKRQIDWKHFVCLKKDAILDKTEDFDKECGEVTWKGNRRES